jgi:small subunit ribosomal protein S20
LAALTRARRLTISLCLGGGASRRRVFLQNSAASVGNFRVSATFNESLMANTKSARKATRQIARRTEVNKVRRSALRGSMRKVEEAIASGDRAAAAAALKAAEPVIMRAAQRGIVHKNNASRKVSRLAHRVAKLEKQA